MKKNKLILVEEHFQFGKNWNNFSNSISKNNINNSLKSIQNLISKKDIENKSILDIGCGSGLSLLSFLKLGAKSVCGVDIDPMSVKTAKSVIEKYYNNKNWSVEEKSIFDINLKTYPKFDLVYSWGVLHHTGDMWRSIDIASSLLKKNGVIFLALYQKTKLCKFWELEKRFYVNSPKIIQKIIRTLFKTLYISGLIVSKKNPKVFFQNYKEKRGMEWHYDIHDWLGGYPYESIKRRDLEIFLNKKGFVIENYFYKKNKLFGLLGSHCDEFIARKVN